MNSSNLLIYLVLNLLSSAFLALFILRAFRANYFNPVVKFFVTYFENPKQKLLPFLPALVSSLNSCANARITVPDSGRLLFSIWFRYGRDTPSLDAKSFCVNPKRCRMSRNFAPEYSFRFAMCAVCTICKPMSAKFANLIRC